MSRKFVVLISAVAITVGYAAYDFYDQKQTDDKKNLQSQIVKLTKTEVNEIQIIRTDGTISLEKVNGDWKINSPIQELADNQSVEDYLTAATLEKSTAVVKEGQGIDYKIFQLDPSKAKLVFRSPQKTVTVEVGGIKNFDGDSYIRVNGEDRVLVASSIWFARGDKKVFDFQDKRLMKSDPAGVSKLTIKRPNDTIAIEKRNDLWVYVDHPDWKIDQNKARDLIASLSSIQAYDFQKIDPAPAVKMSVEATLKTNTWKSSWALNAVQTPDSKLWYKINQTDFDKYFKLKKEALRDRSLPFLFKKDVVAKIDFKSPVKTFSLDHPDSSFLSKLAKLEAYEFLGKKEQLGKNIKEVKLLGKDGDVVFALQMSGPEKHKFDGLEKAVYLAKTNLFDEYIYIDSVAIDNLGIESLAEKKESAR
jgi:hypothetical protein